MIPIPVIIPYGHFNFEEMPSNNASGFYQNFQTIQITLILLQENGNSKFTKIISFCSKTNINEIVTELDSKSHDSYLFSKAFRLLLETHYDVITMIHSRWGSYSNQDKFILITCLAWPLVIGKQNFEIS